MKCPSCGAMNPDGKEFCGDCGAALPDSPTAAAPVNAEVSPPAPEVPAAPAPTPPIPTPAAPQYQQPAPAYVPVTQAPSAAAPKKTLTGPIIAIIAGVLLLVLIGCGIGASLLFKPDPGKVIVVKKEDDRGGIKISKEKGFATPMDALSDVAEQYYQGKDWWYVPLTEDEEHQEYYITPDETTYDKGVVVDKKDGEWFVTDIYTVDMSKVAPKETKPTDNTDVSAEDWAAWVVNEFMKAIQDGRVDDAYNFTAPPLSELDLSKLPGDFTKIEFLGAESQEDGSVVVIFSLTWSDGSVENIGAQCIEGDDGWYISDMGSADSN